MTQQNPHSRFAKILKRCIRTSATVLLTVALFTVSFSAAKIGKPSHLKSGRGSEAVTLVDSLPKPSSELRTQETTELLHDLTKSRFANSSSAPRIRRVWMEVTAYCPCTKCCGPHAAGITASGHDVAYNDGRFVAADTDGLPFGTQLIVPGYANAAAVEVIDRGGAIKGNKLDVFFPTHQQALDWGRRRLPVFIVEMN